MLVDCDHRIVIPYESIPDAYDHLYRWLDARGAVDREAMARFAARPSSVITEGLADAFPDGSADALPEGFPEWFRDASGKGFRDAGRGLALSVLLQRPGGFPLGETDSRVDAGNGDFSLMSFAAVAADEDQLRAILTFLAELLRFVERGVAELDVREGDYETRYRVFVVKGIPHLKSRPKRHSKIDFQDIAWDDPGLGLATEPSPAGWVAAARDTRTQRRSTKPGLD